MVTASQLLSQVQHEGRMISQIVLLLTIWLVIPCSAQVENGQAPPESPLGTPVSPSPTTPPVTVTPSPLPLPSTSRVPQDIISLPDSEGRLIAVPLNVTIEQYLEWLDRQEAERKTEQIWILRNLTASGSLSEDASGKSWAAMRFQFDFSVEQSSEWNSLPLMMGEAVLTGFTEQGAEAADPQRNRLMIARDVDSGQWLLWYRDHEQFQLEVRMLVPIRRTGSENQLLLTLPAASRTELELQLNLQNPAVELNSKGFWERQQNDQGTLVRIAGFQQQIDLTWSDSSIDMSVQPIFDVESLVDVLRQGESTTINARQTVVVEQGALSSLQIKLPSGFQLENVTSDRTMKYVFDAADPSSITLNFSPPVQSSAIINWKLSAPIRRFESQLVIDGFKVVQARKETGKIAIRRSTDWRMTQLVPQSDNIITTDVREITFVTDANQGFRFYNQPIQLVMSAQRSETTFTSESYFDVLVGRDHINLSGEFVVIPKNGVVETLSVIWKDFDTEGWELSTVTSGDIPLDVTFEKSDQLVISTPGWETPQKIRFLARRKLDRPVEEYLENDEHLNLPLPVFAATANAEYQDQILRISTTVPQYAALLAMNGFRVLEKERGAELAKSQTLFRNTGSALQNSHWFALQESEETRTIKFEKVHQFSVCQESIILSEIDTKNRTLAVDYFFEFQIENIPAEEFRFQILLPPGDSSLMPVSFKDVSGEKLNLTARTREPSPSSSESAIDSKRIQEYIYRPLKPILGEFTIHAHLACPFDSGEQLSSRVCRIPEIKATPCDRLRRELINQTPYAITPANDHWQLEETGPRATLYSSVEKNSEETLQIDLSRSRQGTDVGFVDAKVETRIAADGTILNIMNLQIARTPASFTLDLQSSTDVTSAYWIRDGRREASTLTPVMDDDQVRLLLPEDAVGQPGKLVITARNFESGGLTSLLTQTLSLPSHSLDQRIGMMSWDIKFPAGVYLFQPPDNLIANYGWRWLGFGFRRVPLAHYSMTNGSSDSTVQEAGFYRFTSYQWPETIMFRAVGRGLLMTIGCGLPLLIAILILGRPQSYQIRCAMGLIVVFSTLAVIFPQELAVLIQPLLVGVLAIGIAIWGAYYMRYRQDEPTLIIVGPHQDDRGISDGAIQMDAHGVNPDEITRLQPPPRQEVLGSSHR